MERLGLIALKRPHETLILTLLLTILLLPGLFRIQFNSEIREIFRSDSPAFAVFEEMTRQYPGSETDIFFIVEGNDLFQPQPLQRLSALHMDLLSVTGVQDVHSLFSARYPLSAGEKATKPVFPFDLDEIPDTDELKREFLRHPLVSGRLLSKDATLALFLVSLESGNLDLGKFKDVIGEIRSLADEALSGTGLSYGLTGVPVMRVEIIAALVHDNITFILMGFSFSLGIAWLFLRQWRYVVVATSPVLAAIFWLIGTMGYIGQAFDLLTTAVPTLIMAITLSESLFMLFAFRRNFEAGMAFRDALERAIREVGPACFLTYLTTLIALLSLTLVPFGFIARFGLTAALGTAIAFIANMTLIPALASLLLRRGMPNTHGASRSIPENEKSARPGSFPLGEGLSPPTTLSKVSASMQGLSSFQTREAGAKGRPRLVERLGQIAATLITNRPRTLALICLLGVSQLGLLYALGEPHYRYREFLREENPSLQAMRKIDEKLAGTSTLALFLQWPAGAKPSSEQMLAVIRDAHHLLEAEPLVKDVWSLHSVAAWLDGNGTGKLDVAGFLRAFQPRLLDRLLSEERGTAVLAGQYVDTDIAQLLPTLRWIEGQLDGLRQRHPGVTISLTGINPLSAKASQAMIMTLNRSLLTSILIIIVLIAITLRSVKAGLISILPNLLPVTAGGAYLYLSGNNLQLVGVIAFTIGFGISVDSTIHVLNHYRLARDAGQGPREAIGLTIATLGPVLIISTAVLIAGFGVTLLSDMPKLQLFGQISVLLLFVALIGDILFLPAIILVVDSWRKSPLNARQRAPS
ncbi:MAG: MMPL family transporter [Gammaproteobacteria bacterium]|nr:MMPL family transporter [Gammaproteobacteria bacterium]MBU1654324.1 MMPL family transporter [Gammaproteobacteria bacterium]MBU1961201.1 MMPL family transporter [Gammaproteobacteria bacterium]